MDETSDAESRSGAMGVLLIAGIVVVGAGIKLAAPVLVPFVLGVFLATLTSPLVLWLMRRRVPRALSIALAVLVETVILAALGMLFAQALSELVVRLPEYGERLTEATTALTEVVLRVGPALELPDLIDPGAVVRLVTTLFGNVIGIAWNALLALLIAALLLFETAQPGTESVAPTVLGSDAIRRAIREVNKYVAVKAAISAVTGLLVTAWLLLLRAELPVLFGLLAFVLNFIPTLGSILAAAPAIALTALLAGGGQAAVVGTGYLLINVVIGNVVEPRVMGRALGLSPLVVLLSVVVWGWLLGPVGALLSALLTVMVKLMLLATPDLRGFGLLLGPAPPQVLSATASERAQALTEQVVPHARAKEG